MNVVGSEVGMMTDATSSEQEDDLFDETDCPECGDPLDSVEMESLPRMCFACAMLRER